MLFIVLFPAALAIYIGFTAWTPTSGDNVWRAYHYWYWFDGYWEALTSGSFWPRCGGRCCSWSSPSASEFLIGFGLAMLFLKEFRGRGSLTLFFLLPMMVVPAVSGFMFFMIFQVDGPLNEGLSLLLGHDVDDSLARESEPRDVVGDGGRHLAVDAADVPDPPLGARRPARGPDEPGADSRRELLAQIPLPDAADDVADHPDRDDHPLDRGLQGLRRRYLLTRAGRATPRRRSPSGCTAR